MTTETNIQMPPRPADYDTSSAARHAHFAARVAAIEAAQPKPAAPAAPPAAAAPQPAPVVAPGADPQPTNDPIQESVARKADFDRRVAELTPAPTAPTARDAQAQFLKTLNEATTYDGRPARLESQQFRQLAEEAQRAHLNGETIDQAQLTAKAAEILASPAERIERIVHQVVAEARAGSKLTILERGADHFERLIANVRSDLDAGRPVSTEEVLQRARAMIGLGAPVGPMTEHLKWAQEQATNAMVPASETTPEERGGYTLPNDLELSGAALGMLRNAAKAGITQAQIDAFLRAEMGE